MNRPLFETRAFRLFLAWLPYVLAILVYTPSLGNGFLWDDHWLIEKNAFAHDLSHIWTIITHDFWHVADGASADMEFAGRYYRPVVSLAFAVQATLFGLNPAGFHAVSLLFHLACCALVYRALVLRLPGDSNVKAIVASLGTMLFAVHPTRPEVVGWISGATDLLMTFWSLVALNLWASHRHRALGLLGVAVASVLALLSKETAIVLPFALAVDAWLLANRYEVRKELLRASAVIAPVAATMAVRMWLMPIPSMGMLQNGFAALAKRVLASLGEYVIAIVWHVPGTVQIAEARFAPDGQVFPTASLAVGTITLLAIFALGILALLKRQLRPWLADVAWSVAFLAPVANIVPLGMKVLVAARFLYAPLFGVVALLCRAVCHIGSGKKRSVFSGAAAMTIALSAIFGLSSMRQLESFYDDETLWEYEYGINRHNSYVLGQLLNIHGRRDDDGRVLELLRDLQELSSSGWWPPFQQLEYFRLTVNSLANISRTTNPNDLTTLARAYDELFEKGETSFSVRGLSTAIKTSPRITKQLQKRRPVFRLEHALLQARAGELDRAAVLLRETVEDLPNYGRAWFLLSWVHALKSDWDQAANALAKATSTGVPAAEIKRLQGEIAKARAHLENAGNPHVNRALAYHTLRAATLYRPIAEEGLREHPGEPNLVAMLVELELRERRFDAALAWVRGGREAAPELDSLWNHLEARIEGTQEKLAARF